MITYLGDPLHRLKREHRIVAYAMVAVYFGRLWAWYEIERRWGKP